MKGRAVWLYDPANPTEYPDYGDRLIPLTTAKEQVEAAEKERDEWQFSYRIALQAEVELRHKAESERDTALERVAEYRQLLEAVAGIGLAPLESGEVTAVMQVRAALDTDEGER